MSARAPVGKTAVVGAKHRDTDQVAVKGVESTDKETLQGLVTDRADERTTVYTDDARTYQSAAFEHDTVRLSLGDYVRSDVPTHGIKSLWPMLKRAHKGTFHKLSPKHFDRCVQKVAGQRNVRPLGTLQKAERGPADGEG